MQQNLRAGLDTMARELKMAGYDPTLAGGYGITTATKTVFAFTADLCEDGDDPKNSAVDPLCPGPFDASGPTDDEKPNAGRRDRIEPERASALGAFPALPPELKTGRKTTESPHPAPAH